jgi:pimeloyl-ACP methyl ester carboxylesterase
MTDVSNFTIPGPIGKLAVRTKGFAAKPKQVVILVQGANMTGQMGYDFSFEGGSPDYSMMDAFVAAGFGALTFSIRGYGKSDAPADPFTVQTEQAIEDLGAIVDWVHAQGWARPHLLGWSWGGRITGRYLEDPQHAEGIDRLVMLDPAIGGGNKILPAPTDSWWSNTYEYFYNRLEHQLMDVKALDALGKRMAAEEGKSPNGIRLENANGSVSVVPSRLTRPTLMLYGYEAGKQDYMAGGWDRLKFFEALATEDKAFALIPGGGDYAQLQNPRVRIYKACIDFLKS